MSHYGQREMDEALSGAGCILLSCAALLVGLALVVFGIFLEATTHWTPYV